MLIHRCDSCGHPEEWHAERDCSYGLCRCAKTTRQVNPVPELVPRFDQLTRLRVETVCPPGTPPFGDYYFPSKTRTCACDACQAAYAELMSGARS